MAIIGKLAHLDWFFKAYPVLKDIQEYMNNALNPTHDIHKRICSLDIPPLKERCEISYPLTQGVRAIEQSYHLKPMRNAFFESHRVFIDFQLVVEGYEYMLIGDKSTFDIHIPYDESKDLIVYNNLLRDSHRESSTLKYTLPINESLNTPYRTSLLLSSGDLAIFFPDDTHAGGLELTPDVSTPYTYTIKKSVLKVPVSLLEL